MIDADRLQSIELTRDSAGAIAPRGGSLARIRSLRYSIPGFDRAVWRQMAELGWIGLRLGEARGGVGMGLPESVALYEELGRGLVPEPLIAGTLALDALAETGETTLLQSVLAGDSMVALAWQSAPDALDPATDRATRRFVPMHGAADHLLLPVADASGMRLFLLSANDAETTPVQRQDGSVVADLRIPTDAGRLVAEDVAVSLARALDEAALGTGAYLLGVAERAFEITLDYLKQRIQFGQSLASFQALQHRAADMRIALTLCRASVEGAAAELDRGVSAPRRAACVSRAKARAADTAMLIGREAIQLHGAIGYADEADIGLYTRKAMTLANEFGSSMAHRRRFMQLAG